MLSQLVGRGVQFNSCISSKLLRSRLFIWHVHPVKPILQHSIKVVHDL